MFSLSLYSFKSELLQLLPRRKFRSDSAPDIQLHAGDGTTIPRVRNLRVLGLHIEELRYNGHTVKLLNSKVSRGISLIKKVSTKYAGMREHNLLKLIQSFAISHLAYVAAFHD